MRARIPAVCDDLQRATMPAIRLKLSHPMAIKKSELYASLWASCDVSRGDMDASQYKDYVLALLFFKYISDKYAGTPFAPITIPAGASFADMVALQGRCFRKMPPRGDQG